MEGAGTGAFREWVNQHLHIAEEWVRNMVYQPVNLVHQPVNLVHQPVNLVHQPAILGFDVETLLNDTRATIHQLSNLDNLKNGYLNMLGTILTEREMQVGILANRSTYPDAPLQHLPEGATSEQRTKYLDKFEARMNTLMKYVGELKEGIENQNNNWTMANSSLSPEEPLPVLPDDPGYASLDDDVDSLSAEEIEGGGVNRNSPPPSQPKKKKRRNALRRCFAGIRRSATGCFKAQ